MVSSVINYALSGWWDDNGHPALENRLPGGPWHIVAISAAYVTFVTKLGPAVMKTRKPAPIERLIQIYNLTNIVINSVLLALSVYSTNWTMDCWKCDPGTTVRLWPGYAYMCLKVSHLQDYLC